MRVREGWVEVRREMGEREEVRWRSMRERVEEQEGWADEAIDVGLGSMG